MSNHVGVFMDFSAGLTLCVFSSTPFWCLFNDLFYVNSSVGLGAVLVRVLLFSGRFLNLCMACTFGLNY